MKLALLLAAALLVAGCSGGSDEDEPSSAAPTVSVKEFCASVDDLDQIDTVAEAKKAVADLGTPAGMPDDAAAGFEALRTAIARVDADTEAEDFGSVLLDAMGGGNGADATKVQAFVTWIGDQCAA